MASKGHKIFDSDTHVGPVMEILEKYLTAADLAKLPALEKYRYKATREGTREGLTVYNRGMRENRRVLGVAKVKEGSLKGYMAAFAGQKRDRKPSKRVDFDPAVRIEEMDFEGTDVNLMLPSPWFGMWTGYDDVELEMGMYRAFHRWMDDYCRDYPERMGGVICVAVRDVAGSLEEIRRWGKARWAWGLEPYVPHGMPLDHPDLEPIWAAAQEYDLAITLHAYNTMPPYAPGIFDTWENMFIARSSTPWWCGMRNMAALLGNGVMDRYPELRIGTLEAGHGWLAAWLHRLDEHAVTCKRSLPDLKHTPSEYAMSGRYFQSIEIPEGGRITNSVIEFIGEHVLMYASDYPHGESLFPKSVETVMDWDMSEVRKRKLCWDNAVRFFARSGLK